MFVSLRYRNFRLYFTGQVLSFVGSWMQLTAQSWLVYRITGDPFQLGFVAFLNRLPILLFGSLGGAIADRVDRRRLLLCTQSVALLQAVVMAALTLSGRIEVWHVYILVMVLGGVNAVDFPARQVFLAGLVPEEHRHNAIALNSGTVNASRVLGPALAGLIVGLYGEGTCFALNSVSFLAVLAALAAMRLPPWKPQKKEGSAFAGVLAGLRYAKGHHALRLIFLALGILSMAGMPFIVLMPVFAEEVLGSGAKGLGILMAASGVGATSGSLFLARRRRAVGIERVVVRMTLVFAGGLLAFAASRNFALSCISLSVVGAGMILQLAGVNTLIQELSKEAFRGRMMGLYLMLMMGIGPFGSLAAGWGARHYGAPTMVAIGALICAMMGILLRDRLPKAVARHRRRLSEKELSAPPFGGRPDLNA